jgi:predicted alpha/beta-hydrolase family hydrolase
MLLAPGAGVGADHADLVAIDRAVSALGLTVERVDFPYRLAVRRRPDPPAVLEATIHERAQALARRLGVGSAHLLLGGRSMGGRICSQVVSTGFAVAGLVLVSYPLHPPGRPAQSRTAHLPGVQVPTLLISGTRDAFGAPDELTAAAALIAGPVTQVWIEGADHGLRGHGDEVAHAVAKWVQGLSRGP